MGNQQTLVLTPPPPRGTTLAVELIPYDGYGCQDTLYANLYDTLTLIANAGADAVSCNNNPVLIGSVQKQGVLYNWYPATDLSNPFASNPLANPSVTTAYELTVSSTGGGCANKDTVIVKASFIDSTLRLAGKPVFCINTGDSAVLQVTPVQQITWCRDNTFINGAVQPALRVIQSGNYKAILKDSIGCSLQTRTQAISIESPRPGIRYPQQYAIINSPVQLAARNFGETVLWQPPLFLNDPSALNPLFTVPFAGDQLYTIEIKTMNGCTTVDTQLVKAIKEVKIYMPTAFTPNNDGLNDFLKPALIGVKELKSFTIYNRWGKPVFEGKMNERGWNGMINGIPQATDVYVWIIEATGLDNKNYFQKGTVLLLR